MVKLQPTLAATATDIKIGAEGILAERHTPIITGNRQATVPVLEAKADSTMVKTIKAGIKACCVPPTLRTIKLPIVWASPDSSMATPTTNMPENKITLLFENPAKSLSAYSEQNGLDYETIAVKCKVVEEPDTKNEKILTNVAWINGAYDSDAGKVAIDRDSQPEIKPNVNKNNMEKYKGKTDNKDDLSDKDNYYKGEQDDDDFEKLVLKPVVKKFDLALFKHIAAISKDQTIANGEYITDTKNKDGKYLRAPVVKSIENGKVIYEEDSKEALTVEKGDYVL